MIIQLMILWTGSFMHTEYQLSLATEASHVAIIGDRDRTQLDCYAHMKRFDHAFHSAMGYTPFIVACQPVHVFDLPRRPHR